VELGKCAVVLEIRHHEGVESQTVIYICLCVCMLVSDYVVIVEAQFPDCSLFVGVTLWSHLNASIIISTALSTNWVAARIVTSNHSRCLPTNWMYPIMLTC